jgi:ornithine decarboxylase
MSTSPLPRPSDLIARRRAEVAELLATDAAQAALAIHGTPLLLLDTARVERQFRRLRDALPFVRFHYAVKALDHPAALAVLDRAGCGFDVATSEELALLVDGSVDTARIIHTHPIKKPAEIEHALAVGVRTFVVDNDAELAKFSRAPRDVRLLVRLAYRNPHAKSDLSSKFGVGFHEAERLVREARRRGIRVGGFSFHVGSQLDDPDRFVHAVDETIAFMSRLERQLRVRFDTLDIGGGFPVGYDRDVAGIEDIASGIRPSLERVRGRYTILAEPGRILVAEAATLVTSVMGIAERADGRWYYLDDGVYGAYSNVVAEDVHPLVFAVTELDGDAEQATHRWATLAGPTCDSADVIAREMLLPDLRVGDLLASPAMGAYTAVTSTRFNGRPLTSIAVLSQAPATGEVAIPAATSGVGGPQPQTVP